jgi:hypothetical protein
MHDLDQPIEALYLDRIAVDLEPFARHVLPFLDHFAWCVKAGDVAQTLAGDIEDVHPALGPDPELLGGKRCSVDEHENVALHDCADLDVDRDLLDPSPAIDRGVVGAQTQHRQVVVCSVASALGERPLGDHRRVRRAELVAHRTLQVKTTIDPTGRERRSLHGTTAVDCRVCSSPSNSARAPLFMLVASAPKALLADDLAFALPRGQRRPTGLATSARRGDAPQSVLSEWSQPARSLG